MNVSRVRDFEYIVHGFWEEVGDPRVAGWPLVSGGPWTVLSLIGVYLLFVLVLGPQYMKDRKPFDLRKVMLYYNMSNVIMNGLGFILGVYLTNFGVDSWSCRDIKMTPTLRWWGNFGGYLYLLNKIYDFLDTVFFILRKKTNQVTPLHVIHHASMPLGTYMAMKFAPTPHSAFVPIINSLVHTVMYLYYYLAALGPEMQPYLWWKKYITSFQLVQFILLAAHSLMTFLHPACSDYPKFIPTIQLIQAMQFFVFFSSFYVKSYKKTKSS